MHMWPAAVGMLHSVAGYQDQIQPNTFINRRIITAVFFITIYR